MATRPLKDEHRILRYFARLLFPLYREIKRIHWRERDENKTGNDYPY